MTFQVFHDLYEPCFSWRLLVKLHCYQVTIRGSKLPLFQIYFAAVSLVPFGASHKYASSNLLLFAKLQIINAFFITLRFYLVYLGFVQIAFTRSIIAEAYCEVALLVKLSYDYQIVILSHYYLAILQDSC